MKYKRSIMVVAKVCAIVAFSLYVMVQVQLYHHTTAGVIHGALRLHSVTSGSDDFSGGMKKVEQLSDVVNCQGVLLRIRLQVSKATRPEFGVKPWWQDLVRPSLKRPGRIVSTDDHKIFWIYEEDGKCEVTEFLKGMTSHQSGGKEAGQTQPR